MKTFMFPGQGSQTTGMGRQLFARYRTLTAEADELMGCSMEALCLDDPMHVLDQTQFTQPALYVVNALTYLARIEDTGERPDHVVGHSLGEFNALLAADCFDFRAGLRLVKRRGELMSQARGGGMAAILNASEDEIRAVLAEDGLEDVELANFNTPSQIVISGPRAAIDRAEDCFRQRGLRYIPLRTSGAFHSSLMAPASREFAASLQHLDPREPTTPVIANVTARPYRRDEITSGLARQIVSPVRWVESIQYLLAAAAAEGERMTFVEIGPGNVLSRMVDTIVNWHEALPKPAADAEQRVAVWNATYGIGTRSRCRNPEIDGLETRTAATVLFGQRAVVYMKGYEGYFDLREVEPV